MKEYDVLVVGTGSGMNIASNAVGEELSTAVIDKDPIGGTCLNRGCIPSKVMIYPADVIREAEHAEQLGVDFSEPEINFQKIMERTRKIYLADREQMKNSVGETPNLTFYNDSGKFTSDYTMEVSGETITADKIFLFSGSRPIIPPIDGIEEIDYLTNRNIFEINEKPESLIIIGGGYVSTEFAHFFSSVKTDVTILEQMDRLLPKHDPEISELLGEKLSEDMDVQTNHKVVEVSEKNGEKYAVAENTQTGDKVEVSGEKILVAAGRRSNADLLEVENTGVETDEKGWIKVDDHLKTTKDNIWAGGDATGKHMFKHVANYEAAVVWHNAFTDHEMKTDYHAIPSAVYTRPQIASVGLTAGEAKKEHNVLVGKSNYRDTSKGYAMGREDGFCKLVIDEDEGTLLGAQIIGPYAPILIQEVINLMYAGNGSIGPLYNALHIHPSLSEVVSWALGDLKRV